MREEIRNDLDMEFDLDDFDLEEETAIAVEPKQVEKVSKQSKPKSTPKQPNKTEELLELLTKSVLNQQETNRITSAQSQEILQNMAKLLEDKQKENKKDEHAEKLVSQLQNDSEAQFQRDYFAGKFVTYDDEGNIIPSERISIPLSVIKSGQMAWPVQFSFNLGGKHIIYRWESEKDVQNVVGVLVNAVKYKINNLNIRSLEPVIPFKA